LKIIFEKGIAHENIIVTLNALTIHSPQIAKANDFTIKNARFSTNMFCSTSSFLKGSFEAKNSNIEKLEIKDIFFAN
jgi:hypothetical protein